MKKDTKIIAHENTGLSTSIFTNTDIEKDIILPYPKGIHCHSQEKSVIFLKKSIPSFSLTQYSVLT